MGERPRAFRNRADTPGNMTTPKALGVSDRHAWFHSVTKNETPLRRHSCVARERCAKPLCQRAASVSSSALNHAGMSR